MGAVAKDAALRLTGLSKLFEGQQALADVELDVRPGEIHALLGQNGSGKSTLIKVLAGYHRPEPGVRCALFGEELALDGAPPPPAAPIRFVHQDRGLIGDLDAIDNLALGSRYRGRWWLGDRREAEAARRFLAEYGLDIDVRAPVATLSTATQAMLAILRAIKDVPSDRLLLVVDEATASLPKEEVELVFRLLRGVRDRGGSVLYVTHRLGEVFALADRVSVLRDGRKVATSDVAALDHDELVSLIIGRSVEAFYPPSTPPREGVALEIRGLSGGGCHDVSLTVHAGEVVGVTGLVGSGYEALLSLAFGAQPSRGGTVLVGGEPRAEDTPAGSIDAGLAFAPADRKRLSAIPAWSVAENMTLPKLAVRGRLLPWLGDRAERDDVQPRLDQLSVEPRDPASPLSALSGGNQQRVVIARWLRCGFKALMLEDPTMGVDVGAKPAIYAALAEAASAGAGILMTTSDVEEAAAVCDRVVILVEGRVAAVLEGDQRSVDRILATAMSAPVHDLIGVAR